MQSLVRDLNRLYRDEPALWEADVDPKGFQWIDANNGDENIIAFMRIAPSSGRRIICICNFSPVVRERYRIGAPAGGVYREILNSDSEIYGGSNVGNAGVVMAQNSPSHGMPFSLTLRLPPLGVTAEVPLDAAPRTVARSPRRSAKTTLRNERDSVQFIA
jgi:1,4-alpha-glucan branching enzyme